MISSKSLVNLSLSHYHNIIATSNRDSTTIEHSVLPSNTISTVSSPTGTGNHLCCLLVTDLLTLDSVIATTTSNLLPSTSTSIVLVDNMVHVFSVSQQMDL